MSFRDQECFVLKTLKCYERATVDALKILFSKNCKYVEFSYEDVREHFERKYHISKKKVSVTTCGTGGIGRFKSLPKSEVKIKIFIQLNITSV